MASFVWALSMFGFWLYFMYGVILSRRLSTALLQQIREASEEKFDYLHKGSINSAFGVVPYTTVNASRFNAFTKSAELNEYPDIQNAKQEYQKVHALVKRNLIIWFALISVGLVIMATSIALLSNRATI
ncbi:MAG TPA: hypothetical protein VF719_08810 [Abditibacteriaceae bacterium]